VLIGVSLLPVRNAFCCLVPLGVTNLSRMARKIDAVTSMLSPRLLRILLISFTLLITTHWCATAWVVMAISQRRGYLDADSSRNWLDTYWSQSQSSGTSPPEDVGTIYVWALYWSVTTLSTVGFGDISVANENEAAFMVVLLALTTALQGMIVGGMSTMILSSDSTWSHHKLRVDTLKAYMRNRKIPQETSRRVMNYLNYTWATSNGLDETDVIASLPETLQEEVRLGAHRQMIQSVPLFDGISEQTTADVVRQLEALEFLPGDYIVREGDEGRDMMLISNGVVQVLNTRSTRATVYLSEGNYFGELGALIGGHRSNDVIAFTHCLIYSLNHLTLHQIFNENPRSIESLVEKMAGYCDLEQLAKYVHGVWGGGPAVAGPMRRCSAEQ